MSDGLARFKSFQALSQGEESAETSPASETDESDVEPPNKKMARGDDRPSNAIPKWSNPDPYTSLPPPDESKGKKKDVVQMIRKAKVLQDPAGDAQSSVAEDFIPFDFGDDQDQDLEGQSLKNEGRNKEPSTGLPVLESAMKSSVYSLDENILSRRAKTQPLSKKRKLETPLDGSLRAEWMAIDATLAKPWCVTDRSSLQDVGQWLHYEIIDFYDYVRPRSFEAEIRHHLIQRVQHAIVRKYAARVSCFGSFAANMYLPTADMDLVALSDQYSRGGPPLLGRNTSRIHAFAQDLQRAGLMQSDSKEVVAKAKVPLVKYVDSLTGIPVDISFENVTGLDAIPTFEKWSADYPAMPVIVSVVKQFLSMRGLNEMYHGGMNSFTIICLVVSLLQHYPAIQDGSVSQVDILGNILLHFFDFYGNKFERATTEIRVNPPAHLPKVCSSTLLTILVFYILQHLTNEKQNVVQAKADRLCVIDPNNPANDISGGTSLIGLITKIFSEAHRTLVQRMAELSEQTPEQRKGRSILGSIIGGDYSSFEKQRSRLKGLADTHGGSRRRRK